MQNLDNVILTPHIGGSTEEAQFSIGVEVAESLIKYLGKGTTAGSVNFPNIEIGIQQKGVRIVNVHKNIPGVLGEINGLISAHGANIESQFLATDDEIGYLVIEVDGGSVDKLASEIKQLKFNILTRILEG